MKKEKRLAKFKEAIEAMSSKVQKALGGVKRVVEYSAFKTDINKIPVDNLDEVAFRGKIRFVAKKEDYWSSEDSEDYISKVMTDPTWLEVAVLANEMILTVKDTHHVFLELFEVVREEDGVTVAEFGMGS